MVDFKEGFKLLGMLVSALPLGFYAGYKYPRDLELESTAPVEIHYEVTPEAARYLILKAVKGMSDEAQR